MSQQVIFSRADELTHVTFFGKVDGNAVRDLFEGVVAIMEQRNLKLLVDFTGVPMISSGMMGMLVQIKKRCLTIGGQLHVVVADENNRHSFEMMQLHIVLQIFDTPQAARAAFKC